MTNKGTLNCWMNLYELRISKLKEREDDVVCIDVSSDFIWKV